MIAVTIAVGERHEQLAEQAAASVEWSTGLRAYVLRETPGEWQPAKYKLKLLEMFSSESVLYFDADTYFVRKWDVRQFDGDTEFIAVRDMPSGARDADCYRYDIDRERYFNSGIWIANNRNHGRAFHLAHVLCHSPTYQTRFKYEQTALNVAIQRLAVPVRFLDNRYNWLCDPKVKRPDEPVVIHMGGGRFGGPHERIFNEAIEHARGLQSQPVSG
jgi:hypothetical protein